MSYSDAIYFTADGNGNPSRAILVRKSVVAVDGFEDPPEVVGEGAGGGDRLPSGLELGCAVSGGLGEFPDWPACLCFDPAADGEAGA